MDRSAASPPPHAGGRDHATTRGARSWGGWPRRGRRRGTGPGHESTAAHRLPQRTVLDRRPLPCAICIVPTLRSACESPSFETGEAIEHLRGGDADLAVVHHLPGVPIPETSGLTRRRLLVDDLYVVVPGGHRLARRDAVSVGDLEGEPLVLPRRDTPAGRFRSVVEQLCAEAGFAPSVAYEINDLPAAQAFVAAGIAIVPMHGLTLATVPGGAIARPLTQRPAGSRTVEALAPTGSPTPLVDELLGLLADSARAYSARPLEARWDGDGFPIRHLIDRDGIGLRAFMIEPCASFRSPSRPWSYSPSSFPPRRRRSNRTSSMSARPKTAKASTSRSRSGWTREAATSARCR